MMLTECKKRPLPYSNHHYLKGIIQIVYLEVSKIFGAFSHTLYSFKAFWPLYVRYMFATCPLDNRSYRANIIYKYSAQMMLRIKVFYSKATRIIPGGVYWSDRFCFPGAKNLLFINSPMATPGSNNRHNQCRQGIN
jgi:hypothetical protein